MGPTTESPVLKTVGVSKFFTNSLGEYLKAQDRMAAGIIAVGVEAELWPSRLRFFRRAFARRLSGGTIRSRTPRGCVEFLRSANLDPSDDNGSTEENLGI